MTVYQEYLIGQVRWNQKKGCTREQAIEWCEKNLPRWSVMDRPPFRVEDIKLP